MAADTDIATPAISIAGDDNQDGVYNASELSDSGTVTAAISVTGAEVGDTLTYTVGGVETIITLDAENISNDVALEVLPDTEKIKNLLQMDLIRGEGFSLPNPADFASLTLFSLYVFA